MLVLSFLCFWEHLGAFSSGFQLLNVNFIHENQCKYFQNTMQSRKLVCVFVCVKRGYLASEMHELIILFQKMVSCSRLIFQTFLFLFFLFSKFLIFFSRTFVFDVWWSVRKWPPTSNQKSFKKKNPKKWIKNPWIYDF